MTKTQYQQFLKESIANIKRFYIHEQLIPFIGAGISIDSKLPSWEELINDLKNELNIDENDYLKVAQLYYIQYGKNVYYKKLLNIFDLESKKSNILIDEIVKLNCKYIITTNWDDLIEKSIVNNGFFYDIVKKDNDFSKLGINTNILFKIHGDLNDRDIVFKESDYLNYSDEHPLMESFIKSIFMRNVVLLIGYSVSDFNVKQIISWVQNRSNNNLPIYFIESRKEFDYLEFEYFKEKNIYILYIKDFYTTIMNVIDDIKRPDKEISNKIEFINDLYDLLKPFENYNYISGFEILEVIKKGFSLYGINEIIFLFWGKPYIYIQTVEIINILKSKKCDSKNRALLSKLKFIYKIFRKSNVQAIAEFGNGNEIIKFINNLNIDDNIFYFDRSALEKSIYKTSNLLEYSFYNYKLENYYESYKILEEQSLKSFKERDFVQYFICEFNKKQFCNLLRFRDKRYGNDLKEEIESICLKNMKTELFDLYELLPKSYRQTVKHVLDLEKYIQNNLLYSTNKLEDTKKSGKNRLDNNANEIFHFTIDLILYINKNYLMVDHFMHKTYKNIFEIIVYEYQYKKIESLSYVFIYCAILGYSKWEDLQYFLEGKKLSLKLDDKLNEQPDKMEVYNNLLEVYVQQKNQTAYMNNYEQYFKNYFTILTYSNLQKEDIKENINEDINLIAKSIIKILEERIMKFDDYELIDMFISKYAKKINEETLNRILNTFIFKFTCNKFNFNDIEIIDRVSFFGEIFEILKNKKITVDKQNLLSYINKIKDWDIQIKFKIYSYFLIGIYSIVDDELKEEIKQTLTDFIDEIKDYKTDTVLMDYKYLYYEYLLILSRYDIKEFSNENEEGLTKYLENYNGYCSCFNEIYYLIKVIQNKLSKNNYLIDIENIIKNKNEKYESL